ncbi:MAG: undecaprenyldiphospho-muramoylpentapeptide beta-N-acetylglucosaminyltransferase [Gammaproteobacteria bacterium]|jgi:UDP-N-acetylglucosamine--N-acetylmuramyl-(pentapeptide) pyrophosphoryl-undecaprenol N-acetylglucosamine transferase
MVKADKTVLVMAGGTGGHVFPALAVAQKMREQGLHVHWLGTHAGLEARLIPQAGFAIDFISIRGLRGKGVLGWILAPFRLLIAVMQALGICLRLRPSVVLGMGGFVTGPGGIASWLLRKPLVIHEQNAVPGMTNRWLAKLAKRVLEAFPGSFVATSKVYHTGNPVRAGILKIDKPDKRFSQRHGPVKVLIIGGSLGAQALNECVPSALARIDTKLRPDVWHQCGRDKLHSTQGAYAANQVNGRLVEFIDNMDVAYEWADILVCRAGAMTISEISNVGIASILVPYPHAVDDHQTVNAQYLANVGAAVMIQQIELSPQRLADELTQLIEAGRNHLLEMANKALALARPQATDDVIRHCLEVAHG